MTFEVLVVSHWSCLKAYTCFMFFTTRCHTEWTAPKVIKFYVDFEVKTTIIPFINSVGMNSNSKASALSQRTLYSITTDKSSASTSVWGVVLHTLKLSSSKYRLSEDTISTYFHALLELYNNHSFIYTIITWSHQTPEQQFLRNTCGIRVTI